jgi:MFS family permease
MRVARPTGLTAFRHRNYRLYFGGQIVSLIGTWMQQVAQAWLVLQITDDPLWLGIVAAAQFLPILLLGLIAGALGDSLPKRRTILVTQAVKMSFSISLAVIAITGIESIPLLIVIALGIGTANAFDLPIRQAFAVEMVGREDVGNAIALNSATFNSARIIGPAVAGLTIGAVGVAAAFVIDAVSFLAVIVALLAMRESELHVPPPIERARSVRAIATQVGEGLGYIRQTPVVLAAVVIAGVASTVALNFTVVIPPYARDALGGDAATYGFLMAASGVGSLAAALWVAFWGGATPRRIALGALLLGGGEVALGLSNVVPVSMLIMVAVGFGAITMATSAQTTMQLAVPDGLRGRVMSVYTTVFAGSTPIGGPLMGGLASAAGIGVSLAVGGVIAAGAGLVGLAWLRRRGLDGPIALPSRVATYPSMAPSTSAAFRPPNPNEVLSTRR